MKIKIIVLMIILALISVSVSGCGSEDEGAAAASEQTEESGAETEAGDSEDKTEKADNPVSDEPLQKKREITKRMPSEDIFDILYGSWTSDSTDDELVFSAGVGDISYKAELISQEPYAFCEYVSFFDAVQKDDGVKIRFITGKGGVGSCKELVLANDFQSVSYRSGMEINENDEVEYDYITFRKNSDSVIPEDSKWKGSVGAFLGDSITQGMNTSEGKVYWNYLSEMLELSAAEPYGLAGSCISSVSDIGTGIEPFVTRYREIRKDADFIVVFGGTNDYGFNTPLGTEDDTTDVSFYGALYEMLTGMKTQYPDASIVFLTPLHRTEFGGLKYDKQKNDAGYTLYNYIDAIKKRCASLEIPVIDTNTVYGLNPTDKYIKANYLTDGLHPNEEGHRILAERIASCFNSI